MTIDYTTASTAGTTITNIGGGVAEWALSIGTIGLTAAVIFAAINWIWQTIKET